MHTLEDQVAVVLDYNKTILNVLRTIMRRSLALLGPEIKPARAVRLCADRFYGMKLFTVQRGPTRSL